MTKMQYNNKFLQLNFAKFLVPSMLAILGGTVNVLVDDMMLAAKLGSPAIATLNVCMPYFLFVCTIGSLIASGAAILSSQELGKEATQKSKDYFEQGITIFIILGLIVTAVGLFFLNSITNLLAGNGFAYMEWAKEYLFWIVLGTLPKGLLYFPFNYLPIEGNNRQCSIVMMSMLISNATLNYVFIYMMDMGISGAGMASCIASLISCCLGFAFFYTCKSIYVFKRFRFPQKSELISVIMKGSPNALNNLCSAIRIFIINVFVMSVGGSEMIATFAVVNALSEFGLCFINGVPSTAGPLTGVYYSEKSNKGLKMILRIQFVVGTVLILLFGALIVLQTPYWGKMFGNCKVDFYVTVPFALSLLIAMYNSIMVYFYARCNRIKMADFITVGRLVVFTLISLLICAKSESTVWLFLPLCELLTLVAWIIMAVYYYFRDRNVEPILLLDTSLDKRGNILDFSVEASEEKICEASAQIADFGEENEIGMKTCMQLSMAIEEILVLMKSKCYEGKHEESFDLRLFALDSMYGIRIRCMGRLYNPFAVDTEGSEELMGVEIIKKLADMYEYKSILGANNILLLFDKEA